MPRPRATPNVLAFVRITALALIVLAPGLMLACEDESASPTATSTFPPAPSSVQNATVTPLPVASNGDYAIQVIAPADGATLPTTFEMEVAVTGATLALGPAGELVAGGAHWHLFINGEQQPNPYGLPVANIGPLEAGEYKLTPALYLNDMDQTFVAISQVEVTIEE
jgi:hypothetical protein